jgi:hypothetical protein
MTIVMSFKPDMSLYEDEPNFDPIPLASLVYMSHVTPFQLMTPMGGKEYETVFEETGIIVGYRLKYAGDPRMDQGSLSRLLSISKDQTARLMIQVQ